VRGCFLNNFHYMLKIRKEYGCEGNAAGYEIYDQNELAGPLPS
jgi:hypothetical protein